MKIGIVGPGAVGSLIGSLLSRQNHEVIFIGRRKRVEQINNYGIHLKSKFFGDFHFRPRAVQKLEENLDIIFVTVKSYDLSDGLLKVSSAIKKKSFFFSLLNGVGHVDIFKEERINNLCIGTIGSVEVFTDGINVIHPSIVRPHIEYSLELGVNNVSLLSLKNLLNEANISNVFFKNSNDVIWRKLVRLAPISLITSITRNVLGSALNDPKRYFLLVQIINEYCLIASTQGFYIEPEEVMRQIKSLPQNLTTSMQRDFELSKTTEIENILLKPIQLGSLKGLELPYLHSCIGLLKI
jgi:2-dehydropantoate 2-reductase